MKRVLAWVVIAWVVGLTANALADEPTSNVRFNVIRDYNGKPVRNASVVLHPVDRKGKQMRSGLQLKTDAEGNTNFDGVPYGPLRIQVLAPGFQTYGEDFDISKPETQITIKLKRPVDQYSTYGTSKPQATPPPATTPAEPKPDTKPDAQGSAKSEANNDAKPNASADATKEDATKEDKPKR